MRNSCDPPTPATTGNAPDITRKHSGEPIISAPRCCNMSLVLWGLIALEIDFLAAGKKHAPCGAFSYFYPDTDRRQIQMSVARVVRAKEQSKRRAASRSPLLYGRASRDDTRARAVILALGLRPGNYLEIVQVKVAPSAPAVLIVITVLPSTVFAVMWSLPATFQTPSSVRVTFERSCVGSETERV